MAGQSLANELLLLATVACACRDKAPQSRPADVSTEAAPAQVQTLPSTPSAPGQASGVWASWTLADTGLGPIVIGMTPEQANAAVDGALELPQALTTEGCDYAFPRGVPDLGFMIEQGRVVRVDVRRADIRTAKGAGVGDSEERIEVLYAGHLQMTPHQNPHGHYLSILPPDTIARPYRIIFETEQGLVTAIRAGVTPHVGYVEGCP